MTKWSNIVLRGGSGLGDSLYVQSVARHLIQTRGLRLRVNSNWPDVFRPLGEACQVVPFDRKATLVAHYSARKQERGTTQFQDCCISAGLREPVELRLDWKMVRPEWATDLTRHAGRRPIIVVQLPRQPMNRPDGFGKELLPQREALQAAVHQLKAQDAFLVQVGAGKPVYELDYIDLNLANCTTVTDLIDIALSCDGFLGYVSFIVPLAESLAKPLLCVWSQAGLKAPNRFISSITPRKILQYRSSRAVIDNQPEQERSAAVDAFLEQVRSRSVLCG